MFEQLFIFDRWNNFVEIAHMEPQKTAEIIAYDIIEQAIRDFTAALNRKGEIWMK